MPAVPGTPSKKIFEAKRFRRAAGRQIEHLLRGAHDGPPVLGAGAPHVDPLGAVDPDRLADREDEPGPVTEGEEGLPRPDERHPLLPLVAHRVPHHHLSIPLDPDETREPVWHGRAAPLEDSLAPIPAGGDIDRGPLRPEVSMIREGRSPERLGDRRKLARRHRGEAFVVTAAVAGLGVRRSSGRRAEGDRRVRPQPLPPRRLERRDLPPDLGDDDDARSAGTELGVAEALRFGSWRTATP
jgi:hypothetical protein